MATLPFVPIDDGFEVLLITSRGGSHWLLPKGWLTKRLSFAEAARHEAEEEAGVIGALHEIPIGSYRYTKKMRQGYSVNCTVFVYPLLVLQQSLSWPEQPERTLHWSKLAEAAAMVEQRDLARLLAEVSNDDGALLRAVMVALNDGASTDLPSRQPV